MKSNFTLKSGQNYSLNIVLFIFAVIISNFSYGQVYSATDQVIVAGTNSYTNAGRGFRFTPNVNVNITELGKRIPNTLGNYTWTIWNNATNTIVHQQASTSNTAAVYTYEPISTPVSLTQGVSYSIVLYCDATSGAQYYYGASTQINSQLTYSTAVYCNSCTPNSTALSVVSNFHYGTPDFHFTTCAIGYGTDTRTECAGYVWLDGVTYTANNNTATHSYTGAAANGCDSIVTLNLTIIPYPTGTDTRSECPGYTWMNGISYTANNNTATHVLPGAASTGCDSLVVLNLTVLPIPLGIDNQSSCGAYTWINGLTYTISTVNPTFTLIGAAANGCDSIAKLHLVINNTTNGTDTRSECSGFTWIDGNQYFAANNTATYTIVGGAASGCDSVVTLNLTIVPLNVSVTVLDPTITANLTGASYQWLDCGNGNAIISGATSQSFVPSSNGIYAVKITDNGCIDTSACTAIVSVGLEQNSIFKNVTFSPNPTTGLVNFNFGELKGLDIRVYNMEGKLLYTKENIQSSVHQIKLNESPGLYFIDLTSNGQNQKYKLVIQ